MKQYQADMLISVAFFILSNVEDSELVGLSAAVVGLIYGISALIKSIKE